MASTGAMSDRPRISVVVPFFDSERHIAACIESLLAQEGVGEVGRAYEIILIDNGSTDASRAIAGRYSNLVLLSEEAPGAYAARNTGIRRAGAPLIALTDADCVCDPDWLRSILDGMEDPETAVLIGNCRYPAESSLVLRLLGAWENAKTEYVIGRCQPAHHYAYANNMAVRASLFDELGPFEEWRRAADSEFVHRLAARRPGSKLLYRPSMRITHLEFERGRSRARRLRLYRRTNAQIPTFRELGLTQRLGVLGHLLRGRSQKY
jgi:glycosyltransferase involved in cell wall biosynthesis